MVLDPACLRAAGLRAPAKLLRDHFPLPPECPRGFTATRDVSSVRLLVKDPRAWVFAVFCADTAQVFLGQGGVTFWLLAGPGTRVLSRVPRAGFGSAVAAVSFWAWHFHYVRNEPKLSVPG